LLGNDLGSALGAFGHRARMARALGLISARTYGALVAINRLRRHFAHHPGLVSLTIKRVEQINSHLIPKPTDPPPGPVASLRIIVGPPEPNTLSQARKRFILIVQSLRLDLGDQSSF
jgi:hypothetical protein